MGLDKFGNQEQNVLQDKNRVLRGAGTGPKVQPKTKKDHRAVGTGYGPGARPKGGKA